MVVWFRYSGNARSMQMNEPACIPDSIALSGVNFGGKTAKTVFCHKTQLSFSRMYSFSSKLPRSYHEG